MLKVFPLRLGTREGCPVSSLFVVALAVPVSLKRQENITCERIRKEECPGAMREMHI